MSTEPNLDNLAAAFSGAVGVSFSAESSATQHPRMCMYKTRESKQSQWERRKEKLRLQREQRRNYADVGRKLAEEDYANITLSDDEEEEETMDQTSPTSGKRRRSKGKGRGKKKERYYSNQLMLSEWLDDVPSDLAENWLMVPCPVGRRTFIITSRGATCHYTKSGHCVNRFQSALPGGSSGQSRNQHNYSILDCIYSEIHRTYWVLDCMCWHGHPVYDSETEFRFFWLQSKLAENPELATGFKKHPMKFLPLPAFKCEKQVLQDAMAKPMPFPDELDGLLFYHKALHYTPGVTPLVGWLKPWMLPEILGVPIPDALMAKRPPGAELRPPSSTPSPAKPDKKGQNPKDGKGDSKVEAMEATSAKPDKKGRKPRNPKGGEGDSKVEAMDATAAKVDKKGQNPKAGEGDSKVEAMDATAVTEDAS
ncbi:snurportin-1 [Strongylocentrotus purpuratus]|uniref:Snurportin-1 n=1 Tax=Strongylocentrotus purpuratus TaxID=7668 RepID=A0A7M7RHR0_STRPU|nr:snurportin-1 [Strongylocentrotus purpuratus]